MPSSHPGEFGAKYLLDHGIRSQVATSPDTALNILWGLTTTPARTFGRNTHIFQIIVFNRHRNAARVAIRLADGTDLFPSIPCPSGEGAPIVLNVAIRVGNNDVYYQASRSNVEVQIVGAEI